MNKYILSLFLVMCLTKISSGQPGYLDNTFNGSGIVQVMDFFGDAETVAVQDDGKIVIGGNWEDSLANRGCAIVRFLTNGALDSTFGLNGILKSAINGKIFSLEIQADQKIVAGFSYITTSGGFDFLRVNTDGSMDTTFGQAGIVDIPFGFSYTYCYAIALQADGKIVATGYGDSGGGATDSIIVARILPDGSQDTSFSNDGTVVFGIDLFSYGRDIAVQADHKILIAGNPTYVMRLQENGDLDSSFAVDGVAKLQLPFFQIAYSVLVQPDQKILLGGEQGIARFHPDGTADSLFGLNGIVHSQTIVGYDMVLQPDGKIIFSGSCSGFVSTDIGITRFDDSGNVDMTFGLTGITAVDISGNEYASAAAIQPDGKILLTSISAVPAFRMTCTRYQNDPFLEVGDHPNNIASLIYPNPASNSFSILPGNPSLELNVEVYNLLGGKIFSASGYGPLMVDCRSFPPGIYLVRMQTEKGTTIQRIVKK